MTLMESKLDKALRIGIDAMLVIIACMFIGVVIALFFFSMPASAQTVGPDCRLGWNYNVDDEALIDGFRFYDHGTATGATAPPADREIPCADAGVVLGRNLLTMTAFNAIGESGHSNEVSLVYVDSAPGAPTNVRVLIQLP